MILYYIIYNMKKCPPGVICIENVSMTFIVICILLIGYFVFFFMKNNNNNNNINIEEKVIIRERGFPSSWPNFNLDPLLNPYTPPLRDETYFRMTGLVPINVSTNLGAVDTNYRQLGILTPTNGSSKDNILALMGRPLFTNRNKWQYYTTSNQHNNVKLPLIKNGKSCTNEYGCDQLFTNDIVFIEGVNEQYKITLYDNSIIRYLPFI
jgi:hypothetical protein